MRVGRGKSMENQGTSKVLDWNPRDCKQHRGRPFHRKNKGIKKVVGINWVKIAQSRGEIGDSNI